MSDYRLQVWRRPLRVCDYSLATTGAALATTATTATVEVLPPGRESAVCSSFADYAAARCGKRRVTHCGRRGYGTYVHPYGDTFFSFSSFIAR